MPSAQLGPKEPNAEGMDTPQTYGKHSLAFPHRQRKEPVETLVRKWECRCLRPPGPNAGSQLGPAGGVQGLWLFSSP